MTDQSPDDRPLPVMDLPDGALSRDLTVPRRALAVGAHPDDIEFGCGATLAKWADAGCRVHHLVLTDGSKGTWDPAQDRAELVAERRREQEAAARALGGGDVIFCGWTDGELVNGHAERAVVCRWLRELRPDVVLGHDPWRRYRLHPDHRHAGFLLTDALVAARDPLFFADQHLEPHRPTGLLLFEADDPNHVEDVSGFADRKVAALLAHRSQYQSTMGIGEDGDERAFAERVHAELARHGALAGVALGECYRLVRDL